MATQANDGIKIADLLGDSEVIGVAKQAAGRSMKIPVALSDDDLYALTAAITSFIERQDQVARA